MLKVRNLELSYGRLNVVNDVSFELHPGRIQALIGPNGAGKSLIMRILSQWLLIAAVVHSDDLQDVLFHVNLKGKSRIPFFPGY